MEEILVIISMLCLVRNGAPFSPVAGINPGHVLDEAETIVVDVGSNLTLRCGDDSTGSVMWVRDGRSSTARHTKIQRDGSLFFTRLNQTDAGSYTCHEDGSDFEGNQSYFTARREQPRAHYVIKIRTPPLGLNVTITPSTIYALVMWDVRDDGGYPVSSFQIRYRLNSTDGVWQLSQPNLLRPNHKQYELYHLLPNSAYVVEVWANNKLGQGDVTSLITSTQNDRQEIELGKHLLEGVETFDTRAWVVAVGVVMGTLCLLGIATCCLFYKEYVMTWSDLREEDDESIELPNIIVNPTYDFPGMESNEPDENSNDTTPLRVNNNSVVFPARV